MIKDQLTVMTNDLMVPGVVNQVGYASKLLTQLLAPGVVQQKRGVAGNTIAVNTTVAWGNVRHYYGFDPGTRVPQDTLRRFYALWRNAQADMALAGTTLEENLGITSAELARLQGLENLPNGGEETVINAVANQVQVGAGSLVFEMDAVLHGNVDAEDVTDRMPESLDDLFDENKSYHGVAVGDLGSFPSKHPWVNNPPSTTISNDWNAQIWYPRIADNNGTPRTIAKSVIRPALLYMHAFPGRRICELSPDLYDTFSSEFDSQISINVEIGNAEVGILTYTIEGVEYEGCFFFSGLNAPTDRARVLHVGGPFGATFFPYFWLPPQMQELMARGMVLDDVSIPYYAQEWDRDSNLADALGSALQVKYSFVCTARAAQLEIRDLQA